MFSILLDARFWLLFALLILFIYILRGGLTFINCVAPIKGYFAVFKNSKGKIKKVDVLFFCGMPAILATATNLHSTVSSEVLNSIGVIIAILTAMIYSFMAMVNAKYETEEKGKQMSHLTFSWLKTMHTETIDIITTEVLISVFLLLLCFIKPVIGVNDIILISNETISISIGNIVGWLIYCCFYAFILNLLIVTKRFYKITQD